MSTYPYSIRSITQIHPGMANVTNMAVFRGATASKEAGAQFDPAAAKDAESTAELLSSAQGEVPIST
jgi:hypothetical protein